MFSLTNDHNFETSLASRIDRLVADTQFLYCNEAPAAGDVVDTTLRELDTLDARIALWKRIEDLDSQAAGTLGPGRLLVFVMPQWRAYYVVVRDLRSHVVVRHLPITHQTHPAAVPHADGSLIISREAAERAARRRHAEPAEILVA